MRRSHTFATLSFGVLSLSPLFAGCHSVFGIDEFTEATGTTGAPTATVGDDGGAGSGGDGSTPEGPGGGAGGASPSALPGVGGQGGDAANSGGSGGAAGGSAAGAAGGSAGGEGNAGSGGDTSSSAGTSGTGGSAGAASATCVDPCSGETPVCLDGSCVACSPGTGSCDDTGLLGCTDEGVWQSLGPCADGACINGACVPPSCDELEPTCGATGDQDCCLSLPVEGGVFLRQNDRSLEVTLSDFRLDAFEVTVGRFRKFLDARDGIELEEGAGAYPRAASNGWNPGWLLDTAANIRTQLTECYAASYTDEPGENEALPIDCVNWYEAFAFCAWDGGHLPTDAQWSYAAYGGAEQRYYPWSTPPASTELTTELANYNCMLSAFTSECLFGVGSLPLGASRFGQLDLGGNVIEWVMDSYDNDDYFGCGPSNVNCLATTGTERGLRGGSFFGLVENTTLLSDVPTARFAFGNDDSIGLRCARKPLELEAPESCTPEDVGCDEATRRLCDQSGQWVPMEECADGCRSGVCNDCSGSEAGCADNQPALCADETWSVSAPCSGDTPVCRDGACVALCHEQTNCGANADQNCCEAIEVPSEGVEFDRLNGSEAPATVSTFKLERFEVTVGRFREFVDAYPGNRPLAGAGAHPLDPTSGWNSDWDAELPATRAELVAALALDPRQGSFPACTYHDAPGSLDSRAMNCVSWYEAFAFCAFTGGRLPTFAELKYAAVGGDEQRVYPWSNPATSDVIDSTYANYDAAFCPEESSDAAACVNQVGASSLGAGKWGHLDLVGNVAEYTLDASSVVSVPCEDCVDLDATTRGLIGGDWDQDMSRLRGEAKSSTPMNSRSGLDGFRCVQP